MILHMKLQFNIRYTQADFLFSMNRLQIVFDISQDDI